MAVFDAIDFSQHENVVFGHDKKTGLKAIIAVHNTTLGPSLGGCRMFPYSSYEDALKDVLRLSRGMTYKSALAELPLGGGKSVIIGDPRTDKSTALFQSMGAFIDRLGGNYIAAQDSGISVEDLQIMAAQTEHVAGVRNSVDEHNRLRSGDPSPATAYGVFIGIKAAVEQKLGTTDLNGVKIAIQGVGNVGFGLAKHLHGEGAKLYVSDINPENVKRAVDECGATACENDTIHTLDVDVYSPCALGGAINDNTIDKIAAPIIAGCANNQLEREEHGSILQEKGILYAPDFVISAGGIIHVQFMLSGRTWDAATKHVERIGGTLAEIFQRAEQGKGTTSEIANILAEERIEQANTDVLQEGSDRSLQSK